MPADKAPYSPLPKKAQNHLGQITAVDRNVRRLVQIFARHTRLLMGDTANEIGHITAPMKPAKVFIP